MVSVGEQEQSKELFFVPCDRETFKREQEGYREIWRDLFGIDFATFHADFFLGYPESKLLCFIFLLMDLSAIFWFISFFFFGLYSISTADDDTVSTAPVFVPFLALVAGTVVLHLFLIATITWFSVRDLLLVLAESRPPSENKILCLEFRRNASYHLNIGPLQPKPGVCGPLFVRYAILQSIINNARRNGYLSFNSNNIVTFECIISDGSACHRLHKERHLEGDLNARLKDILFAPRVGTNPQCGDDLAGTEENEPWQYDHFHWKFQEVWPEQPYSFSFVAFMILDAFLVHFWTVLLIYFFLMPAWFQFMSNLFSEEDFHRKTWSAAWLAQMCCNVLLAVIMFVGWPRAREFALGRLFGKPQRVHQSGIGSA